MLLSYVNIFEYDSDDDDTDNESEFKNMNKIENVKRKLLKYRSF